jgi:hypothetical protein
MQNWTAAEVKRALEILILPSTRSAEHAARQLSAELGRSFIGADMARVFARKGLQPPAAYLSVKRKIDNTPKPRPTAGALSHEIEDEIRAKAAPSEPTPLERRAAAKDESRLRKEHAELVEQLRDAQERERVMTRLRDAPPAVVKRRELGSGRREACAFAMLSDLHVEESVTLDQSAGVNVYNLEIAEESLARFFEGTVWLNKLYRDTFGVRDMVLAGMGDWMTGYIHEELVEGNSLSPIETCLWLDTHISHGIDTLLEDDGLETITVPLVPGNHGRTTQKIRRATYSENSYEWLVYQRLAQKYAHEPRLKFHAGKSPHKWIEIYDSTIHICHGDDLKYGGGVGGLSIPLGKRVPFWDRVRRADLHLLGHFHQFRDFNHSIVNGSLIGYSAYALSIGAPPEPPQQGYFLWDSKRGKTAVSPLWVRA